jgi:starch synthase (maltosyl-transferring)
LNRARAGNRALQLYDNLHFHGADHDKMIVFSRVTPDFANRILVVICLDGHHGASGMVHLDLAALGLRGDMTYRVHDLIHPNTYDWRGAHNFVSLDPHATFMHLFFIE